MPRIKATRSLLSDLLSALLGAAGGDHMVCEFTCSCCGSSTAAAADALCSFLSDGTDEALAGFSSSNGYTAVQVGLSSRNDAVVCACVRVLAALLHAALGLHSLAQPYSNPGLAGADCWQEKGNSQQHQRQQQQHSGQLATHTDSVVNNDGQQQEPQYRLPSDALGGPCPSDSDDEQLQLQSSSSTCSWQELLQLLLAAAGEGPRSAAVRAAALQELRQVLLHLAHAFSLLSVPTASAASAAAAAPATASTKSTRVNIRQQANRSSSGCELAAARDALLAGVVPLALAALQEEQQELRRVGSQVLAAAVVLQEG